MARLPPRPRAIDRPIALSPDGKEIFSGESSANSIQRFKPMSNAWLAEPTKISTKNNIGTILVFPENAEIFEHSLFGAGPGRRLRPLL